MHIVVFSDRDGTINKDEDYYLGTDPAWKEQTEFLDGVVDGIRMINQIPDSHFFILTNQSGVALQGERFDNLTLERMHEVNQHIIDLLKKQGCRIDGYVACPFVDNAYVEKARAKGRRVNPEYVHDGHPDLKPGTGMIQKALQSLSLKPEECRMFMFGDRASDVEMALRAGAAGILVEGFKTRQLGDAAKVLQLQKDLKGEAYIANGFRDGAEYIRRRAGSLP